METRMIKHCILCNEDGHHYNECRLWYTTVCGAFGVPTLLNTEEKTQKDREELRRLQSSADEGRS